MLVLTTLFELLVQKRARQVSDGDKDGEEEGGAGGAEVDEIAMESSPPRARVHARKRARDTPGACIPSLPSIAKHSPHLLPPL